MLPMDRDATLLFLLQAFWENLTVYRGKVLNHKKNWHTLGKDKIIEENKNSGFFMLLLCKSGKKMSL